MKVDLKKILYLLSAALPNVLIFNYAVAAAYFYRGNGRLPRRVTAPNATFNDFIFHKMIRNEWSLLEQFCVDKEFSKIFAAHAAHVKVAKTISVFSIDANDNAEDFVEWLKPFVGKRLIAKPAHGSGKVLFLDGPVDENAMLELFTYSQTNFFHIIRETQYKNLERKIIVEENISRQDNINDYKFFCGKGNVYYVEVDVDRFVDHKRAICTIPEFEIVRVQTKFLEIPDKVEKPACLDEMVRIAGELSRNFEFVRIDLYDVEDGIYFGEFTFSPGAACDNFSDEKVAIEFRQRIQSPN